MRVIGEITPQPPEGIKYMLGNESWLPLADRSPLRLHCEEWGNLGPLELNAAIKPNKAGFRVRTSQFLAPAGAAGFAQIGGKYFWTADADSAPASPPPLNQEGGSNGNLS